VSREASMANGIASLIMLEQMEWCRQGKMPCWMRSLGYDVESDFFGARVNQTWRQQTENLP